VGIEPEDCAVWYHKIRQDVPNAQIQVLDAEIPDFGEVIERIGEFFRVAQSLWLKPG
jgi:hypothetical protein